MAPLVERHVPAGSEGPRILYVVPTRALVNDLVRRLADPLRALRLGLVAKTGDFARVDENEKGSVLVTTPESFDSLLCRTPRLVEQVQAIVLDEVHLLDGTYRGDQLRVLLERIGGRQSRVHQRVVLSATVHDPAEVARRYAGPDAEIIEVGEPRPLKLVLVEEAAEAVAILRKTKRHKVLWFANRRADVEQLVRTLAEFWPKDRLCAHHGSLARSERLSVEAAMQTWKWGLCVATMTLEIGIDIGDVDAVVLEGPPPTPSAFRQRVGRACRRQDEIFAIGVCAQEGDAATFELYEELARDGVIEPPNADPDNSVIVQQTLSMLYGEPRGLARGEMARLLEPIGNAAIVALVWDHLIAQDWIEPGRGDTLRPTTQLMDRGERGAIHANIPDTREVTFRDASGKVVGAALASVSVGDTVLLAGNSHKVVGRRGTEVQLQRTDAVGDAPRFRKRPSGGAWRWLLPDSLK